MRAKYEHHQRVVREIASAQLLQEEIAKTDPNLLSVASFLSSVCGNNPDRQKVHHARLPKPSKATGRARWLHLMGVQAMS